MADEANRAILKPSTAMYTQETTQRSASIPMERIGMSPSTSNSWEWAAANYNLLKWHSHDEGASGGKRGRNYIVRSSDGPLRGLYALYPFENDYTKVSSVEEGRAQVEKYKRQAVLNFITSAAETNSFLLTAFNLSGVGRDSEMFPGGPEAWNTPGCFDHHWRGVGQLRFH